MDHFITIEQRIAITYADVLDSIAVRQKYSPTIDAIFLYVNYLVEVQIKIHLGVFVLGAIYKNTMTFILLNLYLNVMK